MAPVFECGDCETHQQWAGSWEKMHASVLMQKSTRAIHNVKLKEGSDGQGSVLSKGGL